MVSEVTRTLPSTSHLSPAQKLAEEMKAARGEFTDASGRRYPANRARRPNAWQPHFLGLEDHRTAEDRRRLARRLEAEMRKDDAERTPR